MPYLKISDIQIYYETHGHGQPLFFIHGLGSSTRDWENQIDYFAKYYQVNLFDLRGHGKTDKPHTSYSIKLLSDDTALLIQNLVKIPAHVVGHSLGGMVGFQLALDYPKLIASLTILNSAPLVTFPRFRDSLKFFMRYINVKLFGMRNLSHALAKMLFPKPKQENLREIFIQRWCENDPQAYLSALQAFRGWNVMTRLSQLQCSTLIVTAEHDYTPVPFKAFYTKLITHGKLVVIKDSWHMTMIDQPNEFNRVLLNFLQDQHQLPST